ncbi:S-adenosyl-L-methionine-dependent methyltransferase [Tricharina praecox]|uniref:S-adenosyl-L-methionine-dependent methyltransferase n=1 Tax=Tricharina praecox TaxID=43433 RepID=UPI00221F1F6C|nr:S-adenosyl-L-methionine-dependent methyltransferase [Tricharina praecox]KAI5852293.1 S-adenosyl-L-methionine-dependent methyltransferase [Tricharina praecox]
MATRTPPVAPERYESEHVHEVYQHIASHFSATRFKPWPIVERFLRELPTASIGLDVGCGNGKYLTVNPNVFMIGSDRSSNLVRIAHDRKIHEAFMADALDLPHPAGRFDFAISIAVIHHFSSTERRVASIKSILGTLRRSTTPGDGGRALIYVWALEQKNSRRGWDKGHSQDVFVPWVLSKQYVGSGAAAGAGNNPTAEGPGTSPVNGDQVRSEGLAAPAAAPPPNETTTTYQRYYHLYRQGELEADVVGAGGYVIESGYEKDNWWAICGILG